jgi:uncharacterized protein
LRVAHFNLLNYFVTLDVGTSICGPRGGLECRGANTASELNRQRAKLVAALDALNADVIGLAEVENGPSDAALADLVLALNAVPNKTVPNAYRLVATGPLGEEAIRVGLIYRDTAVALAGNFRVLNRNVDATFDDARNRPAIIQTFVASSGGKFTVAVTHFKSKGSPCNDIGDVNLLDGQGNCPLTRRNAAQALVRFLATDPTGSADADYLILGDLNANAQEDAIAVLLNASYVDLVNRFQGPSEYTVLVDGQVSYSDHALASPSLAAQVTGLTEWHINADELPIFDYNDAILDRGELQFQRKSNNGTYYAPDPFRSADHDPLVLGLNLTA